MQHASLGQPRSADTLHGTRREGHGELAKSRVAGASEALVLHALGAHLEAYSVGIIGPRDRWRATRGQKRHSKRPITLLLGFVLAHSIIQPLIRSA